VVFVIVASMMAFGKPLLGASLFNSDAKEYGVKIRSRGHSWVFTTLYERSYKYFDCTFGCEITIAETGSTIRLESDADVFIDQGILKKKQLCFNPRCP
jgi:hypothetical protein